MSCLCIVFHRPAYKISKIVSNGDFTYNTPELYYLHNILIAITYFLKLLSGKGTVEKFNYVIVLSPFMVSISVQNHT